MTVLVPCRDADPAEIPTGAARLAKTAAEHGWRLRVTYAKADLDDKITESVAVRLRSTPLAAYGVWVDGKFSFAYVWSQFSQARRIGARDLSAFVKAVQP